jgi:hypothetical protein
MHFRSFVGLALLLNRTIVLPNVGTSRLGSCHVRPFEYFYDMDGLRKQFPQLKYIRLDDFKKWTKERKTPPSTRYVEIIKERIRKTNYALEGKSDGIQLKKLACLKDVHPQMLTTEVPSVTIALTKSWSRTPANLEKGLSLILNHTQSASEDFLLFKHHSFTLLFPTKASKVPLKYSYRIKEKAKSFTTRLRPYLAIHWRMETALAENMPRCAESLVSFIKKFKKKHEIKNVYLATDYPLSGQRSQSSTFHKVTPFHHRAIAYLNKTLDIQTWVTLEALDGSKGQERPGANVNGILDKIVCTYADWFFRPPLPCRKKGSSWTSMVQYSRIGLMDNGVEQIKNAMDEWKLI